MVRLRHELGDDLVKKSFLAGLLGAMTFGCIDAESPLLQDAAEGCQELASGEMNDVDVEPSVRAVVMASFDFSVAADELKHEVLQACAGIALDLGASDSWSSFEDIKDAISNAEGTGACDHATRRIEDILLRAGDVGGKIAISAALGECHLDFAEQTECDKQCTTETSCMPGSVETRCEPGELSVICEASCKKESVCVGSADKPANCMGQCQSECVGLCHGTCIGADGKRSENNPNCVGKCASSCNGKCRGLCKVEADEGIACGENIRCTGSCSGSFSDPQCTTQFTPPACQVDTICHEACSARVMANAACDATTVDILAALDVEVAPELQPLKATLETHLPVLIDATDKHGRLALNAAFRLVESGTQLQARVDDFNGKSLACLRASMPLVANSLSSIQVSVEASARLKVLLEENSM